MFILNILLGATSLFIFRYSQVNATPMVGPPLNPTVKCDEIGKYTTNYFLGKIRYQPPANTCLFYTYKNTVPAIRYAGNTLTTIWDMWPCHYYDGDDNTKNPLRCIFKHDKDRNTYFENMSRAMALSCDVSATVMTKDPANVPQDGIWGRIEQPTLKKTGNPGGQVDTITAVDPKGDHSKEVWTRPKTLKKPAKPVTKGKPKACYTPEQLEKWFGTVPW